MLQKYHIIKAVITIVFTTLLFSCAKDKETKDEILKDKEWLPSLDQRVKKSYDEGKGFFGNKGVLGNKDSATNIKFGNSNVMWRATLKTLENIPLINVDYIGGVIITDWYGGESYNQNESQEVKITVKFTSEEIRISSFSVISHKKTCVNGNCSIKIGDGYFNNKIKDKIIENTKSISLAESKNKK